MKTIPRSKEELLTAFARETARMSYPGSMSRGKHPVVEGKTKEAIECYFTSTSQFPMEQIWDDTATVARTYDQWHAKRTHKIVKVLEAIS